MKNIKQIYLVEMLFLVLVDHEKVYWRTLIYKIKYCIYIFFILNSNFSFLIFNLLQFSETLASHLAACWDHYSQKWWVIDNTSHHYCRMLICSAPSFEIEMHSKKMYNTSAEKNCFNRYFVKNIMMRFPKSELSYSLEIVFYNKWILSNCINNYNILLFLYSKPIYSNVTEVSCTLRGGLL